MKVIGITNDRSSGYLVEISENEMANLVGHYSTYSFGKDGHGRKPSVGDTVDIAAMYRNLRELASTKTQFEQAKKILLAIADNLDLVEPVVLNITDQIDGPTQ